MYVPGKLLSTADTLSRSSICCVESFDNNLLGEVENHVDYVIAYLTALNNLLQKICDEFVSDRIPVCSQVINFCQMSGLHKHVLVMICNHTSKCATIFCSKEGFY